MLMESLTEKLLRQVGWQGRVQNNRNSPLDVRSLDCQVLTQVTQTYSPNFFSSRFWRAVVSFTVIYKHTSIYMKPEALKSLYRSPGNKKNQLVLCKNYVLRHLGITINIKNTKFVKDLPMIDAQFRFNQCNSFREEYISVFSPYGSVLILWPVVAAILDFRSA